MAGIGIGGLGSGIDSNAIITQLLKLETIPINQLEGKKKIQQDKLAKLGEFKTLVKDLQAKAATLSNLSNLLEFTVSPSQEGVATFAATGTATEANHSLKVLSLAAIDRWAFNGVTDKTVDLAVSAGEAVSFTVGGQAVSVTLDPAASSLEEIAGAINTAAGDKVEATVVNTGTTGTPSWQLVLTSKTSGEDGRLTGLTSTVAGLTINGTGPDVNGVAQSTNNITVGTNAVAVIDGLTVERTTNDFTDVIQGVSITVEAADPLKTITFGVDANADAIVEKVEALATAYNKIVEFINKQNTYTEDSGPGGPLFGDSVLRQVRSSIDDALFNVPLAVVQADTTGYSTLNLLGIEKEDNGTLKVDKSKLEEKILGNLDAFADLFVDTDGFNNGGALPNTPGFYTDTTADAGLADKLDRAIERMFGTSAGPSGTVLKGLFDAKNQTLNDAIKRLGDQIEDKQYYLEKYEAQLVMKFAKLEDVMGGLNAKGAALQQALVGMI
jgi:flagellar hook-associated protein 2